MRKQILLLAVVGVFAVLMLADVSVLWAKAHVPLGRAQVCTSGGTVQNVQSRAVGRRIAAGGCRLTACVFNDVDDDDNLVQQFIFLPGDDCDATDDDGDGFCDSVGAPRTIPKALKANNVTPACTDPF